MTDPPQPTPSSPDGDADAVEESASGVSAKAASLLAAGGDLADMMAEGALGATMVPEPMERAGSRIGRYKLLQQIGEGGFGVVYMAEQVEPVRRRVALKIIKPGMDSREVIARFEAERQALALMNHPHIAMVLDAGMTETGRPYFVMELVKGVPLARYCDQARLGTRDRLRLFIDVCEAVQHAHQKGVIHRDLKPSNILVTEHAGRPVVKVIDFGIAKALDQELTEKTLFTAYGKLIGTPQYMRPEQAEMSGLDVDTRSDIYSLGILLYELLTGATPLDPGELRTVGFHEIQRKIREESPRKPSTRVSGLADPEGTRLSAERGESLEKIGRALRGDLDWIILKALEKDRDRRYDTAHGLANDLCRFLNDEPVSALPPTLSYQLTKFARRHRRLIAGTCALFALLLTGVVGMTALYLRSEANRESAIEGWESAEEQAARAQQERDRALHAEREAQRGREEAEAAREAESRERQRAEAESRRADRAARRARLNSYGSDMRLASRSWEDENISAVTVERALAAQFPAQGEEDLRDFAWRVQWKQLHGSAVFSAIQADTPALSFQKDGTLVSYDGGLAITTWDAQGRASRHALGGDIQGTDHFALSPDGRSLLLRVGRVMAHYSVTNGIRLVVEIPVRNRQGAMEFSPDGRFLLEQFDRSEIRVWDLRQGLPHRKWTAKQARGSPLALSRDGERAWVRAADNPKAIRLLDGPTNGARTLAGHSTRVSSAVPGPAGTLVSGDEGGGLILWPDGAGDDDDNGAPLNTWSLPSRIDVLAVSPDGSNIAAGCRDGLIWLVNQNSGERRSLKGHTAGLAHLAFSPDGKRLASGDTDQVLKVWETRPVATPKAPAVPVQSLRRVVYSPNGKWLAMIGDRATRIRDLSGERDEVRLPYPGWGLVFSPDSRLLAIGAETGAGRHSIRFWNLREEREEAAIPSPWEIASLAYSPDGSRLVAGKGIPMGRYSGKHPTPYTVWNLANRTPVASVSVSRRSITDIVFNRDGSMMATVDHDGWLRLWETRSWGQLRGTRVGGAALRALVMTPGGDRLVTGGARDAVELWSTDSGDRQDAFRGHMGDVTDLAVSPDGRTAASASLDQTVKLWDIRCRVESLTLRDFSSAVMGVAFSPDGTQLAAVSEAGALRTWHAPTAAEIDQDAFLLRSLSRHSGGHLDGEMSVHAELARVAARQEQALGPEHPDTLRSWWWLGRQLWGARDYETALEVEVRAARIANRTLGRNHTLSGLPVANARGAAQPLGSSPGDRRSEPGTDLAAAGGGNRRRCSVR